MAARPRIAVVGSINLDLVASVERLPRPGETLTDAELSRVPGGKGANQAVAAARLGAEVRFVGCVGRDEIAGEAKRGLEEAGVDLTGLRVVEGDPTGLAMIVVSGRGDNQIVVAPGANRA
ncbi:MAG TPA: PfkB family carbohydrate kinase, partial [Gaiellaceae bacterium]|nr:PfkB family carbohydrate kinase [Gaiellaceae bacterium]